MASGFLGTLALAQPLPPGEWKLAGPTGHYEMTAEGTATASIGATLQLRSINPATTANGNVYAETDATPFRKRRVVISGELSTKAVNRGAALWVRADQNGRTLVAEDGGDRQVRAEEGWLAYSVSLVVPESATSLRFGARLWGTGELAVRNLRLAAGPALTGKISDAAREMLASAITIVRQNAMNRSRIDWQAVEPELEQIADGAEAPADSYPAIKYLLASLQDSHSHLLPARKSEEFKSGHVDNPLPAVELRGGGVGYIRMYGYSGVERNGVRDFTERSYESLRTVAPKVSHGWIIDLRPNSGGNMWPMLAALRPFLGSGTLGYFASAESLGSGWQATGSVDLPVPDELRDLEKAPVAILTGPRTASSGEAVVVAFRGRPSTRSFGQPTSGLSTANAQFPLPDGALIFLTTRVMADRDGTRYGAKIEPDERVESTSAPAAITDATAAAAEAWLKKITAGK